MRLILRCKELWHNYTYGKPSGRFWGAAPRTLVQQLSKTQGTHPSSRCHKVAPASAGPGGGLAPLWVWGVEIWGDMSSRARGLGRFWGFKVSGPRAFRVLVWGGKGVGWKVHGPSCYLHKGFRFAIGGYRVRLVHAGPRNWCGPRVLSSAPRLYCKPVAREGDTRSKSQEELYWKTNI